MSSDAEESGSATDRDESETRSEQVPLNRLTVAELSKLGEAAEVVCPEEKDPGCPYQYQTGTRKQLGGYDIGQLVKYPQCEYCGCYLAVVPNE